MSKECSRRGQRPFSFIEKGRCPHFGFSLIEILLVIALLAIVTAVTIPQFNKSYQQLQLRDSVNDIAYLMRYAQSRAIHTRRSLQLVFDDQRTSYWLMETNSEDEDPQEEQESQSYARLAGRFGRTFKIPDGMTVNSEKFSVVFNPDGRIEKMQMGVCHKERCLIISTQNQSGYVAVAEAE